MGALYEFDLEPWMKKYGLNEYVETGGGLGTCLNWARKYNFSHLWSVELDKEFADDLKRIEKEDPRVSIINDYSIEGLDDIISLLSDDPVLFWHDAHFVGNPDHHKTTYEESIRINKQKSFPLRDELCLLSYDRSISRDVFIIDDLALYDENLQCDWCRAGNKFQYRGLCKELGIDLSKDFIYDILGPTHDITIDYRSQGYLIALPKNEI